MSDQLSTDLASLRIARNEERPRGRGLKTSIIIVLIIGISALAYYAVAPRLKTRVFKTEVAFTEIMTISPVQETIQLTATGYVVPQTLSKVAAKVSGRVAQVLVKEGDKVTAGTILLKQEDSEVRANFEASQKRVFAAQASVEAARANLFEIRLQADRQKILVQRGVSARATADDLGAKVASLGKSVSSAEAQVKVSQAEVVATKVNLQQMVIKAPIDGVIISKPPLPGDFVVPEQGAIFELADLNSLMVEADVPEGRLHLVHKGAPCEIVLDAFPDQRRRGEVHEVGWRVNRSKATIAVKVKFVDSVEGVLPDMAARVNFLSKPLDEQQMREPAQIIVPANAVVERGGAKVVFVYDDGKVRMTPVSLGKVFGQGFVLKEGPPSGTRIVKNPQDTLVDGISVKERNE